MTEEEKIKCILYQFEKSGFISKDIEKVAACETQISFNEIYKRVKN